MPGLSAKFAADFQSFYTAVDQANAKLRDFQSGAGHVETALNRMVDSFSGRKLIQDAMLASKAVEDIGGASRLTSAELQTVARLAADAVAKMKALGVEVPPRIAALAEKLKEPEDRIFSLTGSVAELGAGIAAAFSVREIVAFVNEVAEGQRRLQDLSLQTGIGVEKLQVLSGATREYGIDNQELGRALYQLQRRIAGGDDSVATGLAAIGLSLESVRSKDPYDLFVTVARALGQVGQNARAAAAADLFGGKLGSSLVTFSTKVDEAIAKSAQLPSVTNENSKALAEYARSAEQAKEGLGSLAANIEGRAVTGLKEFYTWATNGKVGLANLLAETEAYVTSGGNLSVAFGALADSIKRTTAADQELKAAEERRLATEREFPSVVSEQERARRALDIVEQNANQRLEGWQTSALQRMRELGVLNAKNAQEIADVNVQAFERWKKAAEEADVANRKLAEQRKRSLETIERLEADVTDQITKHHATATEAQLADIHKRETDTLASLRRIDQATEENVSRVTALYDRLAADVGIDWATINSESLSSLRDQAATALRTYDFMALHADDFSRGALQRQIEKYRELAFHATAAGQAMADGQDKAGRKVDETNQKLDAQKKKAEDIQQVFSTQYDLSSAAGFQQFQAANPNALINVNTDYFKTHTLAEAIAAGLVKLNGRIPGFASGVENFTGGPAIVGERGPELVTLPRGSNVLPFSRGGGSTSIVVHQYVSGVWDLQSRHALTKATTEQLEASLGLGRRI